MASSHVGSFPRFGNLSIRPIKPKGKKKRSISTSMNSKKPLLRLGDPVGTEELLPTLSKRLVKGVYVCHV